MIKERELKIYKLYLGNINFKKFKKKLKININYGNLVNLKKKRGKVPNNFSLKIKKARVSYKKNFLRNKYFKKYILKRKKSIIKSSKKYFLNFSETIRNRVNSFISFILKKKRLDIVEKKLKQSYERFFYNFIHLIILNKYRLYLYSLKSGFLSQRIRNYSYRFNFLNSIFYKFKDRDLKKRSKKKMIKLKKKHKFKIRYKKYQKSKSSIFNFYHTYNSFGLLRMVRFFHKFLSKKAQKMKKEESLTKIELELFHGLKTITNLLPKKISNIYYKFLVNNIIEKTNE